MTAYTIVVSLGTGGVFDFDPFLCIVDRSLKTNPSHIFLVLDETVGNLAFSAGAPEFAWEPPAPNGIVFPKTDVLGGGKILRIENFHSDANSVGYWPYWIYPAKFTGATSTESISARTQETNRGKNPVIINK